MAILFLTLANLLLISERSGYRLRPLSDVDWDVAMMLTPWGLVDNWVIHPGGALSAYYFEPAGRVALASDPVLLLLLIIQVGLALVGLWRLGNKGPV